MRCGTVVLLSLTLLLCGCASVDDRVIATPAVGVEHIPTHIAIYPLLTSESPGRIAQQQMKVRSATTSVEDDRLYIVAPAETRLVSTIESQLLTGILMAELSALEFTVKELPVEAPAEQSEKEENSFFVSLQTLRHLRENYGLEAILVGNVYFVADERDPTITWVRTAYMRLVDTATLDVLCHVSISDGYRGDSMEDVAGALARALARQARIASSEEEQ